MFVSICSKKKSGKRCCRSFKYSTTFVYCRTKKGYALAIQDKVIPENNGVFDLDGTPTTKTPDITLSAGEATQLLLGYHSISELCPQSKEKIQELEANYPKQKCYIIDEY